MNSCKTVVYPLWVVTCEDCGFVCTVWEKPGTGCSYIEYCPSCGKSCTVRDERVEDKEAHESAIEFAEQTIVV